MGGLGGGAMLQSVAGLPTGSQDLGGDGDPGDCRRLGNSPGSTKSNGLCCWLYLCACRTSAHRPHIGLSSMPRRNSFSAASAFQVEARCGCNLPITSLARVFLFSDREFDLNVRVVQLTGTALHVRRYPLFTKTSAGSLKRLLNFRTCSKVSLRCPARNMETALSDPNSGTRSRCVRP